MNKFNFNKLTPFKWFVLENFPFIEADFDALTEWQLFCKLGKEINKIVNSENTLGTQMENVTNAFIDLQNYINNYFDNLDVQEEINNKLDEMAENGELDEIVGQYITDKIERIYNTVSDMKADTSLIVGMKAKTLGYYAINDGGNAEYEIVEPIVDNLNHYEILSNDNYAKLISNDYNIKQFGAKGDGLADDTNKIQSAIEIIYNNFIADMSNNIHKIKNTLYIPEGIYRTTDTIDLPVFVKVVVNGNAKLLVDCEGRAGLFVNSRNVNQPLNDLFQNFISGTIIDSNVGALTIHKKTSYYDKDTEIPNSVGLEIGDRTFLSTSKIAVSRCVFRNINIKGFETGLALNYNNMYMVTLENIDLQQNYKDVHVSYYSQENAGERITFRNCLFANARYGIYSRWGVDSLTFENCSFDYVGCLYKQEYTVTGLVSLISCHIEGIGTHDDFEQADSHDLGYICYYNNSDPKFKLRFSIKDSTLYPSGNNGTPRFGSKLAYASTIFSNYTSYNQSFESLKTLDVSLDNFIITGIESQIDNNTADFKQLYLGDNTVKINTAGLNVAGNDLKPYYSDPYEDYIGRFLFSGSNNYSNYYKYLTGGSSGLTISTYNSSTAGEHDTAPLYGNALSISASSNRNNIGISRIINPKNKDIEFCIIYKLNNIAIENNPDYDENITLYGYRLNSYDSTAIIGNEQLLSFKNKYILDEDTGWKAITGVLHTNNIDCNNIALTLKIELKNENNQNLNFTGTCDIAGFFVNYK